jgi:peptidoglycan hydrolase-like protein with peptidoglycan-binding domain
MDSLTVLYLVTDSAPSIQLTLSFNPFQETRHHQTWGWAGLKLLVITTLILGYVSPVLALQPGYQSPQVSELQQTLQAIGYYYGPITGYYGVLTQAAIRQFQADHGLKVDGIAGLNTLRVLQSATRSVERDWDFSMILQLGSVGATVVQLQQYLQVIGYYDGGITGYYGVMTQAAVERFQAAMGLRPTGIVDADTLAALEAEIYELGADDVPLFQDFPPHRGNMRRYWHYYQKLR